MQHLEVNGAARPLKWPLGVKWLRRTVPKCPQIRPAIALPFVPTMFDYTPETVAATIGVRNKIHDIVGSTARSIRGQHIC